MSGRAARWAGAVAITFLGLILVVLVAIFSLLRGCSVEVHENVVVFGTAFDERKGETMLLWPADDAGDAFRCVVFSRYRKLHEQALHEVSRESGWTFPYDAPESIVRVLLVLAPDASDTLRARATELLDAAAAWRPDAGLHRVYGDGAWNEATTARAASLLLRRLSDRSGEIRREMSSFGDLLEEAMLPLLAPGIVVIVRDDEALPYVVGEPIGMFARTLDPDGIHADRPMSRADLEAYLEESFDGIRRERADWPIPGLPPVAVFVVPADASAAAADRAAELVRHVAATEGRVAGLHRSRWTTAELLGHDRGH